MIKKLEVTTVYKCPYCDNVYDEDDAYDCRDECYEDGIADQIDADIKENKMRLRNV